jgi:predicted acyltransferase
VLSVFVLAGIGWYGHVKGLNAFTSIGVWLVASPGGSMVSLLLAALRYGVSPTGFVWLSIPEVNRCLDGRKYVNHLGSCGVLLCSAVYALLSVPHRVRVAEHF